MFLEADLRQAIDDGEVGPVYQPVVLAQTGLITSVEALARGLHPQRGSVPPEIFIPLAKDSRMIVALGEMLLRKISVSVRLDR